MAQGSSASRKHWAVLVGIDYYTREKCLHGCVRDVQKVKEYLDAGPDPKNISILTATTPPDPSSGLPLEDSHSWPTSRNLTAKLKRVIQSAKRGDFVYIHYSGHGSREPSSVTSKETSGDQSTQQPGNLALVLFHNNKNGQSYFYGNFLAKYLRKMVDNGLLVTVVLDCCFSGSVLRDGDVRGASIRAVEYNPDVDVASLSEDENWLQIVSRDTSYPFRDASLQQDQWLVNPDGYTILSACGPHEIAQELTLRSGEQRGALSYLLMETLSALKKRGIQVTHECLYEHLRIWFHACWPRQTPMRYGNRSFSFFNGPAIISDTPFVQVYAKDKRFYLDVGEAHGVHAGDTYALYPPGWLGDAVDQTRSVSLTAQVDIVHGLTSGLTNVTPETATGEIVTGWIARPLTSLSQHKISVRLPASLNSQAKQVGASEDQRYLHLCSEEDNTACVFTVVLDDQNRYKILDVLSEAIVNLPAIPADAQGADQKLMDSLQHISKFKYAESIENRMPDVLFEASFSLVSSASGREQAGNTSVFDVEHGDTWQLKIKNNGDTALYFALFDFEPSWKVQNLLSDSGNGDFWVLEPGQTEPLPLVMEVPESMQINGRGCCEDIIKLFVTSNATSFPSMVLPELPLWGSYHRGQPYESGNGLSALVAGLTGSVRSHDAGHEKWTTRNFLIRTTKK